MTQIGVYAFELRNDRRHRVLSSLTGGIAVAKTGVSLDPHRLAIWRAAESTSLSRSRQSSRGKRQENATLPPLPGDSTPAFTRGFADSSSILEKRSRRTGRSRHATVSSPNMSRVNFNGSSYANSSKSRLVTARRAALCKSQALRLPSSAISSSPVILPTHSASTGVFLPQPRHSWFYENLYLARKFHRSAPKPISFSHDRQATHSDGQTAAFAENHS
jgi:hypothetical protein